MTVQLLHGDCLELMKTLPDKSVDCFVCDLPYGQLSSGGIQTNDELKKKFNRKATDVIGGCPWDVKIDLAAFWVQVKRLAKNDATPVLMFCNTKFGFDLYNSNPDWFRYDIVWDKGSGVSFLLANKMPMKSHEMIYVFSKKGAYYKRIDVKTDKGDYVAWGGLGSVKQYGVEKQLNTEVRGKDGLRCPLSVLPIAPKKTRGGHPTEKPIALYEWLLARYVPEGGTVLDPTAGSFNSILAARNLNLNAIGIEKDDKFFEAGKKKFPDTALAAGQAGYSPLALREGHTATPTETPLRNEVVLQPAGGAGDC